ncbi:MAG: hypothetical protein PUH02_05365 [bacterium]|nr:hypothetical protein [bacterium]
MKYAEICKSNLTKDNSSQLEKNSKTIFDDMYEQLKEENESSLAKRKKDLSDTLTVAFQITKNFTHIILAYILGNIVLLALDLQYYVTCVSILLMGACFIYKLVEFLSNKYCIVDAYILMIYKSVLEKLAGKI